MAQRTGQEYCGTCDGHYEYTFTEADTPEGTIEALFGAREQAAAAHRQWHADNPGEIHIRRQINPRRVRGNGFYRVNLGASEDGSQTLCGDPAGNDITWADSRYPRYLATVTCRECKNLRGVTR